MSRILARSVIADLLGRIYERLLFLSLLPFIFLLSRDPDHIRGQAPPLIGRATGPPSKGLHRSSNAT